MALRKLAEAGLIWSRKSRIFHKVGDCSALLTARLPSPFASSIIFVFYNCIERIAVLHKRSPNDRDRPNGIAI
jgi:hypothetical protein